MLPITDQYHGTSIRPSDHTPPSLPPPTLSRTGANPVTSGTVVTHDNRESRVHKTHYSHTLHLPLHCPCNCKGTLTRYNTKLLKERVWDNNCLVCLQSYSYKCMYVQMCSSVCLHKYISVCLSVQMCISMCICIDRYHCACLLICVVRCLQMLHLCLSRHGRVSVCVSVQICSTVCVCINLCQCVCIAVYLLPTPSSAVLFFSVCQQRRLRGHQLMPLAAVATRTPSRGLPATCTAVLSDASMLLGRLVAHHLQYRNKTYGYYSSEQTQDLFFFL